jgi:hypothetical protein
MRYNTGAEQRLNEYSINKEKNAFVWCHMQAHVISYVCFVFLYVCFAFLFLCLALSDIKKTTLPPPPQENARFHYI